jgi:hypothetical protein
MYLFIFFQTFLLVLLYSLVGGWILIPFYKSLRYPAFIAPLTGILVSVITINGLYTLLQFSMHSAVLITFLVYTLLTLLTCVYFRSQINFKQVALMIAITAIIALLFSYLCNYATIVNHSPSLLFMDGTDQSGYIQMATWLIKHPANTLPVLSPSVPYQSWLNWMYFFDARLGINTFLASVATLLHTQPFWAFDLASTVIVSAAILTISGLFSRSRTTLLLLIIGTATCFWFAYSRDGFFGRLLGAPADILVVGLFLTLKRPLNLLAITALSLLACAASICYPGQVLAMTVFFVAVVWCPLLALKHLGRKGNTYQPFTTEMPLAFLLILISIAATGALSHAVFKLTGQSATSIPWWQIIAKVLGILDRHQVPNWMTQFRIIGLTSASLIISIILLGYSLFKRRAIASTLMASSLLILLFFFVTPDALGKSVLFQLSGFLYPLTLFGAAWLYDDTRAPSCKSTLINKSWIILLLIVILIAMRLPRFASSINRYAGSGMTNNFSKRDIKKLAHATKGKLVTVGKIDTNFFTIPLLVGLHPYKINLQWSPTAWKAVVGYRNWPAPTLKPTPWRIELAKTPLKRGCSVQLKTQWYQLLYCQNQNEPNTTRDK